MSEDQKSVVKIKPGFVFQPIEMQGQEMTADDPVIIAKGLPTDQVYNWMEKKLTAFKRLKELQNSKEELAAHMALIDSKLEDAVIQSRLEIFQQD